MMPSSTPRAPKPDITIVVHDAGGVGGMEVVLSQLIRGLLEKGHPVTVISRTCKLPQHDLLTWVHVPGPRRPFALAYPWFFVVGSLITWRRRVGVVLSTGAIIANRVDWSAVHMCHHAADAIGLSRMARRTPWYRLNEFVGRLLRLIGERFCYRPRRAGGLIGVSRGVSAELAKYFPRATCVTIPNGVNLERFHPDPLKRAAVRSRHGIGTDELIALFVGGEWMGKGLKFAIDALARADGWKLLVVGNGVVADYRQYAQRAGVLDRVIFAGAVDDPSPYYCASDTFVLPSAYETFSLVTYEAAASGLPLLVTPVHGVTDLLVDGRNGWFIERDGESIATRLSALREDDQLRAEMGAAGRAAAAAFTWPRMVEAYRQVLLPVGPHEKAAPEACRPAPVASGAAVD
jgi:glycosyltransferase involved in cell wall biosynthesis